MSSRRGFLVAVAGIAVGAKATPKGLNVIRERKMLTIPDSYLMPDDLTRGLDLRREIVAGFAAEVDRAMMEHS